MATNSSNGLDYFLVIDSDRKDDLAKIRNWTNLKVGTEAQSTWVKGFDLQQVNHIVLKSIPYKKVYYEKEGMLYLLDSALPDRVVPTVLWTAIDRALPVEVPSFNHNFFGLNEQIELRLIPSTIKYDAVGMLTTMALLKQYLETAPAIRLKKLSWVVLNDDQVFILGVPQLPIQGAVFWKFQELFIPVGFDFELQLLKETINILINRSKEHWIVWNQDTTYFEIKKDSFKSLSLSSFRLTEKGIN